LPFEFIRYLWCQAAKPGSVQIKNKHGVHVCARQTMLSFVFLLRPVKFIGAAFLDDFAVLAV
jgi:hypothetical protein